MECESFWTDPRMFRIFMTIVEDLAMQIFVGIISSLFSNTVEFALRKKKRQTIWFLFLFLDFFGIDLQ